MGLSFICGVPEVPIRPVALIPPFMFSASNSFWRSETARFASPGIKTYRH
jgi:hypothetical protein